MTEYTTPVNQFLKSIDIQPYDRYLPNAFNDSLTMLEKVNKVIHHLNENNELTNEMASKWNEFVEWVNKDGINDSITDQLNTLISDGEFNSLIIPEIKNQTNEIIQTVNTELIETTQNINSIRINALYPPKPLIGLKGDNITDDTLSLQTLIDYLSRQGGGSIEFPKRKYFFEGTITLKGNVSLQGVMEFEPWNGNGKLGNNNATYFRHAPKNPDTDFMTLDRTSLLNNYFGGINIKNLYLEGSENSRIGLDLQFIVNGNIQNLLVLGFGTNIRLKSSMKTTFERVSSMFYREFGLKMSLPENTTTTFYRCYFGQTQTRENAIPISIDDDSTIGVDFISCVVESSVKGIYLGAGNILNFDHLYTENIPSIHSPEGIVNIGLTDNNKNNKGIYNFNGGSLAGSNAINTFNPESKIFNVNYSGSINVVGVMMARSGNVIKYTNNSKGITFIGCYDMQITNGTGKSNIDGKLTILNDSSGSNQVEHPSYLRRFKMKSNQNTEYEIEISNTQSKTDLRFKSPTGIPLWLDHNSNIRHNYEGSTQSLVKTDVYGAITRPDFTNLSSSMKINVAWVEDVDGVTQPFIRLSDSQIYPLVSLRGPTSQRPQTPTNGSQYFDTTISKPIWFNGGQWKDANGIQV